MSLLILLSDAERLTEICVDMLKTNRQAQGDAMFSFIRLSYNTQEVKGLREADEELVVPISLKDAKALCVVLNDFLIAHPYEKEKFFAELTRLEEKIKEVEEAIKNEAG